MLNNQDLQELLGSGLTKAQAHSTGHFSASKKWAKNNLGINQDGIVFRYCDTKGQPYLVGKKTFNRIKPRWDENNIDAPKYLSPSGMGNKPYFSALTKDLSKLAQDPNKPIVITEGEKKADCLNAHGFFAIGLSGVYGWLDKCPRDGEGELEESRILPELQNEINWSERKAYIAFDSDIVSKPQVKAALKDLASALKGLQAIPYVVRIPNEINGDKNGADDFIVRHGRTAFETLIDIATPALNSKGRLCFPQDPTLIDKIYLCHEILKDHWRYRPGMGYYHWKINHWRLKTTEEFERDLILFQDAQGWRDISCLDVVVRQLRSRLLVGESLWNPDRLITFKNGTLDCTSGNFFSGHCKEDFCTSILDYNYNPDASCPKWIEFLRGALGDEDAVELIRAFVKWILTPKSPSRNGEIQKCLDITGQKGTGKGTFLDILTELVGRNNYTAISTETFSNSNYLASMLDKKVSIDFDAHGCLKGIGAFNSVVANEPIQVKYLYKNPIEVRLRTVVVRAYNQYLETSSGSEGLDRRIVAVSFSNRPKKIDLGLPDKLRKEISGIFSWAWSLPLDEAKKTIMAAGTIDNVKAASIERFEANNPEYVFLVETFLKGKKKVKASNLYKSYSDWSKDAGYSPKKNRKFYESIQRLGCQKSPKSNGCFYYDIPDMRGFDLVGHIGLATPIDTGSETETPVAVSESPECDRETVAETPEVKVSPPERQPRGGDRIRGPKGSGTISYLMNSLVEIMYDYSGKGEMLAPGEWEYLPRDEDPKARARAIFERSQKGDKLKILNHPFHDKEHIGQVGRILSRKHTMTDDYVAIVETSDGQKITCYLESAEFLSPKEGDQVRYCEYIGKLIKIASDGTARIDWDTNALSMKLVQLKLNELIAIG